MTVVDDDDEDYDEGFTINEDDDLFNDTTDEEEVEFDLINAFRLFNEPLPRPLSPIQLSAVHNESNQQQQQGGSTTTTTNHPVQMKQYKKNSSWEDYMCSLRDTCISQSQIGNYFESSYMAQEYGGMERIGAGVWDTFASRSVLDKSSVVLGSKSFGKVLQSDLSTWQQAFQSVKREKRLKAPKLSLSSVTSPAQNEKQKANRLPVSAILGPNYSDKVTAPPPLSTASNTATTPTSATTPTIPTLMNPMSTPTPTTTIPTVSSLDSQQTKVKKSATTSRNTYSDLSFTEHKEYMEMMNSINQNPNILRSGRYIELSDRVESEQNRYLHVIFTEAMMHKAKYRAINPDINSQLEKLFDYKRQIVQKLPANYTPMHKFAFHPSMQHTVHKEAKILLKLGKIRVFRPHIFTQKEFNFEKRQEVFDNEEIPTLVAMQNDTTSREDNVTQSDELQIVKYWRKAQIPSVNNDPIITDHILKSIQANQTNSITFILSSSPFKTVLSTLDRTDDWTIPISVTLDEKNNRSLFFSKPLLKKQYTAREKNTIYYRTAMKSFGLNVTKDAYEINYSNDPQSQQFLEIMKNMGLQENVGKNERNVTYSLFDIDKHKVLFRYGIDGVVPDSNGYKPIVAGVKLEYLGKKKHEKLVPEEVAKWWAYHFMRPEPIDLQLARMDPALNRPQRVDRKSVGELLQSASDRSQLTLKMPIFDPGLQLRKFVTLLNELQQGNLSPGTYLLMYSKESSEITIMREAVTETNVYNLHSDLKHSGITSDVIHYIPTAWSDTNQIPYTFPVDPTTIKKHKELQQQQQHKKKRKKKGKQTSNKRRKKNSAESSSHSEAVTQQQQSGPPANPTVNSAQ